MAQPQTIFQVRDSKSCSNKSPLFIQNWTFDELSQIWIFPAKNIASRNIWIFAQKIRFQLINSENSYFYPISINGHKIEFCPSVQPDFFFNIEKLTYHSSSYQKLSHHMFTKWNIHAVSNKIAKKFWSHRNRKVGGSGRAF